MNQNLEQLKKLAQIFNTDKLISPEEIQQIFKGIVEILATYKKDTSSINEDTKSVVNKLLEDVISIHKESVDAVEEKKKELGNDFADKLTELRQMVTSVEERMYTKEDLPVEDTDNEEEKQALIAEIMAQITLPEVKATIVSGEEIVDKINELPLDEDNKIDWARIKNAPKIGKQTITGSPTVLANAVDLDGSTRANNYAIVWDATRGRYTHTAMSGGGTPGGSTTQLQYNNAGSFGGISGATTDGTAVTFATDGLLANTLKSATSAGTLFESNSGTDVLLLGAGGGAGATFYGGVNIGGSLTVDTNTLYVDATNNRVGVGNTSPATTLDVTGAISMRGAGNNRLLAYSNDGTIRTQLFSFDGLGGFIGTQSNHSLFFRTNDTTRMTLDSTGLGIGTTAPTHSLTLNSTSTGIALYNTADQTTNYERGRLFWSSNVLTLSTELGGTGTARAIQLIAVGSGSNSTLTLTRASLPTLAYTWGSTATTSGSYVTFSGTNTASSGTVNAFAITPTINQATTAGYTALLVNPTETTTGSGSKLLADFQVGGTSRLSISNGGEISNGRQVTGVYSGLTITNTSTAVGDDAQIVFRVANLSTGRAMIRAVAPGGSDTDLAFYTSDNNGAATEKVRINAAGQLSVTGGITKRVVTTTDDSTAVINVAVTDVYQLTAIANNTTFSFTGTPTDGQNFIIRYKDAGVSKTLTWTGFTAIGVTLPTATTAGKWGYVGVTYNSAASQYHVTAVTTEA